MNLKDMFSVLGNNTLPSARERRAIRVSPISNKEIKLAKWSQNDTENYYNNIKGFGQDGVDWYYNNAAKNVQNDALKMIPDNTQLDLFATSGEDAFKDLLDSDAVTGMTGPELGALDAQFSATSPTSLIANILKNAPQSMENINNSNVLGPNALNTAETLGRLYRMLLPR